MESTVAQLELALLRAQLHAFERRFYEEVGPRYIKLDQARAQAMGLKARYLPQLTRDSLHAQKDAFATAEECRNALSQQAPESEDLKRLHRELARYFHPDFASDHARKAVCQNLMVEINAAYAEQDFVRLEILGKARELDRDNDSARQLAELAASPANQVREQTEYAGRHDRDLMSELGLHLLKQVEKTYLAGARLEYDRPDFPSLLSRAMVDLEALESDREIAFPVRSLGEIFTRPLRDAEAPLRYSGFAQGLRVAPFHEAVILRLAGNSRDLTPLSALDPADLQGLINEPPNFINLNDDELQPLARFRGLEVLGLSRTEVTGRLFDRFPTLHELRVLRLDETRFDDSGMRSLAECVWMQQLNLAMTRVTGAGLAAIRNMNGLLELNLSELQIQDEDLAVLCGMPRIRHLNLSLTKLTDAAAGHLAHLHELESINLGGTGVTDRILEIFYEMPRLRDLILWETGITDEGLQLIADFPALEYLDVDHTKVTTPALRAFRPACPRVRMPSDLWAEQLGH